MGLRVSILRPSYGSSSAAPLCAGRDHLVITNIAGPFEPSEDAPAAMIVRGNIAGAVRVVPVDDQGQPARHTAMGGNYCVGDDRFDAAARKIANSPWVGAIPIHDYPIC